MKRFTTVRPARAALGVTPGPLGGFFSALALAGFVACLGCVHASSAQADPAAKKSDPAMTQSAQPNQPAPIFSNAVLVRGCTQEDAPALEMYFSNAALNATGDPTPPYLHFEISSSATESFAPATLELSKMGERRPGRIVRAQYAPPTGSKVWLTGTVVLDELTPGDHISGHYTVATPDGQRFQDAFRLKFTPHNAVCG